MPFKKIDKEFLLTDSSVNSYGYRLLTSGYLLDEFRKNPVGYYLHGKEESEYPREMGVLVRWEDFRQEGDSIYAKPCINLNHPRGERTVNEIESGFLNAASLGHFVVIEISENPNDYLPGQTGVTVSRWYNRECSLVDIPGNYNALTDLFDENNNPLDLNNLKAKPINMKQILLTPEQMGLLNLKADADAAAVTTAVANLAAEAAKVPELTAALASAKKAGEDAKTALENLQAATAEKEVNELLSQALVDKKLTKEVSEKLKAKYAQKPEELKDLLDAMPAIPAITSLLGAAATQEKEMAAKSWNELDREGLLPALKAANPALFLEKYKTQFKKDYQG